MIRHVSRIRIRPRRKGHRSPLPEQLAADLAAKQIELNVKLYDRAGQILRTTLEEMKQRTEQTAQTNPELASYVNAYLVATSASLIDETLAILADQSTFSPPPQHQPHRGPLWRFPFHRLVPVRARKEQPDGAA